MKKFAAILASAAILIAPVANASVLGIATTGDLKSIQAQIDSITATLSTLEGEVATGGSIYNPSQSGGGGGVSTSTTNTFSVAQNFNGISNTGNVTSTSFSSTSTTPSYILDWNGQYNFPTASVLAIGATCGGTYGVNDAGSCVNDFYVLGASSTPIFAPPNQKYSYTNPIQATSSQAIDLYCPGGNADVFTYTGATSTPGLWIDTTSYTVQYGQVQGSEIDNCSFNTTNSATTTAGQETTGILVGGANVTPHVRLNNVAIHNFSIGLNLASNTYDFEATNIIEVGNGETVLINSANNSGEGDKFYNPWWADPANSSSSNCIVLQANAVADLDVFGGSSDSCGWNIATGNLSVNVYGLHQEDPDKLAAYFRMVIQSSNSTHVLLDGGTFYDDGTLSSTVPTALIDDGGVFTAQDVSVADGATSSTITSFVTNAIAVGVAVENVQNLTVSNGAITNTMNGGYGLLPYGGTFTSYQNSYPVGCGISTDSNGGQYECYDGGSMQTAVTTNGFIVGPATTTIASLLVTSSTSQTASTSIAIGPTSGSNKGELCLWNGSNYTKLEYTANATSTILSTSTTCTAN